MAHSSSTPTPPPALAKLAPEGKSTRVPISLKAPTMADVELYVGFYKEAYGEDLPVPKLLAAMIEQFMSNDPQFKKWCKQAESSR